MSEETLPTHPLENSWTLWYDSKRTVKPDATSWEENLQTVQVLSNVEEFWAMLSIIKKPGQMEISSNYHFFKTGIKPMWEDPANHEGGKWVITLQVAADLYNLDSIWEELLMALIGEYLDDGVPGDHITGCVLGKRRNATKISIWTKDKKATSEVTTIGTHLKELLKVSATLEYHPHGEESHEPSIRL
jgi:translation initiation factor 4E